MIIDCISDLHGFKPTLEGGDLLIVAGDLTARDEPLEWNYFYHWLSRQDYEQTIIVPGNHDGLVEQEYNNGIFEIVSGRPFKAVFLVDDLNMFHGFKIWGSPWTPTFFDWAFMKDRGAPIKEKWDLIPDDIDILITHGPPFGILDYCSPRRTKRLGCEDLFNRINELKSLKLHVFGHIHGGYGRRDIDNTTFVNAAIMDEEYKPTNKPVRIIL